VRAAVRQPRRTLLVWALVLFVACIGLARLRVDTTTDSVLDRSAEPWAFYQASQERFGGDEIVVVALEGTTPFDTPVLREVRRLTRAYEALPGVRRVDSLASVPLIRVADDTLILDGALETSVPDTPEGLQRLAAEVAADRIAPRNLVSEDGRVFALNVVLAQDFAGDYDALVAAIRAELPAKGARMSGVPVFRSAANERTRAEILVFVPLTVLAIASLLVVVFRQVRAAAIAVAVGAIGSFAMVGAMGLAGVAISLITMILPSVILALGCSYVMRVLSAASGARDPDSLLEALLPIALPVALSGLTTAIGFAVVGVVRIEEVRNVGAFGAVGVFALTAASLTIAPAAVALWPLPSGRARGLAWSEGWLRRVLMHLATRRRAAVFGTWLLLLVVFSAGLVRIDVETDATRWFPRGTEVRDAYEAIREELSGISPVNVVLESKDGVPVTDPRVMSAIDGLTAHLEGLEDVGKAVSLADPLRQIHGGFSGDPSLPLPDSAELIEQYLLLLESVDEIRDLVTPDRAAANVVLRADNNGSGPLLAIGEQARRWWREHGVVSVEPRATGIMYEFARAEDEIAMGQIRGLGLGLLTVGVILLAALRNARLTAIALVPNVVPIAMVFGFMGLSGVPLDAGTVIVGSLALGIAVDDTIHLIAAFQEDRERGCATPAALDAALARVLHPVVFTTLAVAIGFGLLGFSQFTFTRNLGLLVAGTMLVCLLADLALLPSLLARLQPRSSPPLK
jgi:hypothetical protein